MDGQCHKGQAFGGGRTECGATIEFNKNCKSSEWKSVDCPACIDLRIAELNEEIERLEQQKQA